MVTQLQILKILVLDIEEENAWLNELQIDKVESIKHSAVYGDYLKFAYILNNKCILYNDNVHLDFDALEQGMKLLRKINLIEKTMSKEKFEEIYNVHY